jgi:prepilin-type N-terminal cleavage/methylation domain-containing protein
MIESNRRLKRSAAEGEEGFTLIELLIVIVVLGILAAIVVFALNGVTGQSTAAACQSDAKTVGVGVSAFQTENPTITPASSAKWESDLLGKTVNAVAPDANIQGGPFLQSWPNPSGGVYSISVAIGTEPATSDTTSVSPAASDVLVTANQNTIATPTVYDATLNPDEACNHLKSGT